MPFVEDSFLYLLYISTIAGLATTFGCLVVLLLGHPPERLLAALLAGAGGVMLAVVLLDLIPLALHYNQPVAFYGGGLMGALFMWLGDFLLKGRQEPKGQRATNPPSRRSHFKRVGILVASGIALHDIPEGMAIAVGQASTAQIGAQIAIAIALHNLPEGMATATPLRMAGVRDRKILMLTALIALFTPLGAILGKLAIGLISSSISFFVAVAAGAMTFLVLVELWPLSRERYPGWALFGAVLGFLFFLVIAWFLPHA